MINFAVFGINFGISVGFMGVVCLMLYVDRFGLMLPTIMAIILHELGHLTILLAYNQKPKRVEIKVGAVAIIGKFVLNKKRELLMLCFGSAFNFIFGTAFYICHILFKNQYLLNCSLVMLVVGVLNLLPIIGLDGGDILKLILLNFLKIKAVNFIIYLLSLFTAFLIVVFGGYVFLDTKSNISLILFGIYLFLGILISKKQKKDCNIG
ncbi:MAG: hypothetical protein IJO49_01240 [Clostridia bacterium]|nr:hypothetical protein [Clostridia bacterium]